MKLTKNQIDKLNIELTMNIEPADYAEIKTVRRNLQIADVVLTSRDSVREMFL